MYLRDKTALVTGAGTGIGAAIARRFVSDGAKVCVAGLYMKDLENVVNSLPEGTAVACQGDVSDPEDAKRMVDTCLGISGRIDILINCAGVSLPGSVTEIDVGNWRRSFDVNVNGPFLLMREAIPHMIRSNGGSIVNIASLAGLRCLSNHCAYTSSKSALIALTKQAALDYGKYNIRLNAICPGFVLSEMTEKRLGNITNNAGAEVEDLLSKAVRDLPIRHVGGAEDIAGICSFLSGDDSSYITGTVIPVDGGTAIVDAFGVGMNRAMAEMGII
jgi:NAD(P)-dependent dehydrogenase (short-subunit alcohol dehydrogenase family)